MRSKNASFFIVADEKRIKKGEGRLVVNYKLAGVKPCELLY